jgi:mitochondrial fission protein ELM1
MMPPAWILSEPLAGLKSQALGLVEALGVPHEYRELHPRAPWSWLTAALWPKPLAAVPDAVRGQVPGLLIGCGGTGGVIAAALRTAGRHIVQIQNPRIALSRFDLVVANRHDGLTGPNVLLARTALHRVTPARLAEESHKWRDVFAHLKRPLVSVLVGGSNGRFRLDAAVAAGLAGKLLEMMRRDRTGIAVTPSRRTDPEAVQAFREILAPAGAYVWDGSGENPYFAMLALADAIVVTQDSVSMISEAAATEAPVFIAALPGRSRRQAVFIGDMLAAGRVRWFEGRFAPWPAAPLNDTPEIAAELRRRLGF